MSDLGFRLHTPLPQFTTAPPHSRGFRIDPRFAPRCAVAGHEEPEASGPATGLEEAIIDPVSEAYALGLAEGHAQAMADAAAQAAQHQAARDLLEPSFQRLDKTMEGELADRLRETVLQLCETTMAPLAIDESALARRVAKAASMLARADDERVIRLHPEDVVLLSERCLDEWAFQPDPSLERGTIRVEGVLGGVEDGPATWRQAIAEALQAC